MEQGSLAGYAAPEVTDYGSLVEMTAAAHLMLGAAHVSDLSFSSPVNPVGGGTVQGGGSNSPGPPEGPGSSAGTIADLTNSGGRISDTIPGASTLDLDPGGGSTAGGATTGGGAPGGGASGGGPAGGGHLPFTGFAVGVAAAIGSALAAGGTLLRRATRQRRHPEP